MAVSTAFAGAKLESLFLSNASATPASSPVTTHLQIKPRRTRANVRCDSTASSDSVVVENAARNASSLSALEQLKTSAADRK